jgi:hypothetical protein
MFEFAPMGLVYVAIGLAYCFLLVRKLPDRDDAAGLTTKYQLTPYLTEVRVPATSRLTGRTVVEERISDRFRLTVLEIVRGQRRIAFDLRSTPIQPEDILIVRGTMEDIVRFKESLGLLLLTDTKLSDADLVGADSVLVRCRSRPSRPSRGRRCARSTSGAATAPSCSRWRVPAR